jgi:hypothetical protein
MLFLKGSSPRASFKLSRITKVSRWEGERYIYTYIGREKRRKEE